MHEAELLESVANVIQEVPDPKVAAVIVIRMVRATRVRAPPKRQAFSTGETLLVFPCVGDPNHWDFTDGQRDHLMGLYPNLDVMTEARKALAWIEGNSTKRKTAGGMQRFLASWFNREVNSTRKTAKRDREAEQTGAVKATDAKLSKLQTCTFHQTNPEAPPPEGESVYWCALCYKHGKTEEEQWPSE